MFRTAALISCAALIWAACSTDDDAEVTDAPTWHADVQPIVEAHCQSCHAAGGIGPFPLVTYEDAAAFAEVSLGAIETGRMPPWLPDPDCRSYVEERLLPEADKATFRAWVEGGKLEGAAVERQAQQVGPDFEATHEAHVEGGYLPAAAGTDDYRCFILDVEFPTTRFLTASQVVPDAGALVHHVLVYAMDETMVPDLQAADAAEAGPGYTCFGGPFPTDTEGDGLDRFMDGETFPNQIAAWVPGNRPAIFEAGSAIRIAKGSRLVMQIHYNLLSETPVADATALHMTLTDEPPERLLVTRPAPILELDIPAGEAQVDMIRSFTNYRDRPITIRSLSPHMHLLGSEFDAYQTHNDGSESCMLRIEDWDFNWQQAYILPEDDLIVLEPGESFRMRCSYDNSPANQPEVAGEPVVPRDVEWGEGTLDEMCLLYLTMEEPYNGEDAPELTRIGAECAPAGDCLSGCAAGQNSAECLLECADVDASCFTCTFTNDLDCMVGGCGLELLRAQDCLVDCGTNAVILDGNAGRCMKAECGEAYDALTACMAPLIDDGTCLGALQACGLPE